MVKRNYLAVQSIPEVKKYEESRPDSFMPGMWKAWNKLWILILFIIRILLS